MKLLGMLYLSVLIPMSLVTFAVYGWDKHQARQDGRRISEKRLHWLAALGGWPGALIGRQVFHHKTRKALFTVVTWMIVLIHGLLITGLLYYWATAGPS